jgi:hypothetical protein
MKPHIDRTQFGSICVDGKTYEHDVVIRLNGSVRKRKKKLSKAIHGTSHVVSRDEAKHIHDEGAVRLIVGTGQHGILRLSEEADQYFSKKGCKVKLLPTPEAIEAWNKAKAGTIGVFHVTC